MASRLKRQQMNQLQKLDTRRLERSYPKQEGGGGGRRRIQRPALEKWSGMLSLFTKSLTDKKSGWPKRSLSDKDKHYGAVLQPDRDVQGPGRLPMRPPLALAIQAAKDSAGPKNS